MSLKEILVSYSVKQKEVPFCFLIYNSILGDQIQKTDHYTCDSTGEAKAA